MYLFVVWGNILGRRFVLLGFGKDVIFTTPNTQEVIMKFQALSGNGFSMTSSSLKNIVQYRDIQILVVYSLIGSE